MSSSAHHTSLCCVVDTPGQGGSISTPGQADISDADADIYLTYLNEELPRRYYTNPLPGYVIVTPRKAANKKSATATCVDIKDRWIYGDNARHEEGHDSHCNDFQGGAYPLTVFAKGGRYCCDYSLHGTQRLIDDLSARIGEAPTFEGEVESKRMRSTHVKCVIAKSEDNFGSDAPSRSETPTHHRPEGGDTASPATTPDKGKPPTAFSNGGKPAGGANPTVPEAEKPKSSALPRSTPSFNGLGAASALCGLVFLAM